MLLPLEFTTPMPLIFTSVAPVTFQLSTLKPPELIVEGDAVNDNTTGLLPVDVPPGEVLPVPTFRVIVCLEVPYSFSADMT